MDNESFEELVKAIGKLGFEVTWHRRLNANPFLKSRKGFKMTVLEK